MREGLLVIKYDIIKFQTNPLVACEHNMRSKNILNKLWVDGHDLSGGAFCRSNGAFWGMGKF
jgi:hypothetical protein